MQKILSTVVACLLMVAITGCGKSAAETAMSDTVSKMKDQVAALKSVTDEASAKAAAPKLKAISDDMKKTATGVEKMATPSADEQAKLAKYVQEMSDVSKQMSEEMMRIGKLDPKLMTIITDAMK